MLPKFGHYMVGHLTMSPKMVEMSLCLSKHHNVKTYMGMEVQLHTLTSVLNVGNWLNSYFA